MSYAQRKEISGNRTLAIVFVVVIQFAIGYAIITGLAYNVLKKTASDLKTFNVEEQPPPPEKPPPPPKDMPKVPPPPMVPPPLVQTNPPPIETIQTVVRTNPPPMIPPVVAAPPAPPAPPPPRQVQPRSLTGSLQGLFSGDDYPPSAQDNNETGTVSIQLTVGPNGRVVSCSPSGATPALRDATCRIAKARARFSPAQDSSGNPTTSTTSATIQWRLE
jgi:protein TonB